MSPPSRSARLTTRALLTTCAVGLALAVIVYSVSPSRVPIHYGTSGQADGWGSPVLLLLVHVGLLFGGTVAFLALPEFIRRGPTWLINLPNREYWLADEHRNEAALRLSNWSCVFGTCLNVFVILLQLATWSAKDGVIAPGTITLLVPAFLLFTLASLVWLLRALRLPRGL